MVKIKKTWANLANIQIFRYAMVGGLATIVDWGAFYLFGIIIDLNYQAALAIAFVLGSVTNYILNKIFTFRCKSKKIASQASMHLAISGVSLLLNMGLMFVLVSLLSAEKMLSRIIVTLIMLVINYFMHKNLTFNKKVFADS